MDFDTFSARAREIAAAIPPEYMEGIDVVDVHKDAKDDLHVPGVQTLGMCETSHLSDPTGQVPFRSVVHLYYGSFVALARQDRSFDVEKELEETIRHEVQHHLEDRAGIPTLRDEDALYEAHARFKAGLDVPPGWYRWGEEIEEGLWSVDLDLFLELRLRRPDWERLPGTRVRLSVMGEPFEVEVPADAKPDEIWSFEGEGLYEGEEEDRGADEEPPGEEEPEEEDGSGDDDGGDDSDDLPPGTVGDLHVVPIVR
jgi:hypothetical protein